MRRSPSHGSFGPIKYWEIWQISEGRYVSALSMGQPLKVNLRIGQQLIVFQATDDNSRLGETPRNHAYLCKLTHDLNCFGPGEGNAEGTRWSITLVTPGSDRLSGLGTAIGKSTRSTTSNLERVSSVDHLRPPTISPWFSLSQLLLSEGK